MIYCVAILADLDAANRFAAELNEAGIASLIREISPVTNIVFVARKHGKKAEAIRSKGR